jgi:hypothetical protein
VRTYVRVRVSACVCLRMRVHVRVRTRAYARGGTGDIRRMIVVRCHSHFLDIFSIPLGNILDKYTSFPKDYYRSGLTYVCFAYIRNLAKYD